MRDDSLATRDSTFAFYGAVAGGRLDRRALLRTADGQGLSGRGDARPLFPVCPGCCLSAGASKLEGTEPRGGFETTAPI